VEHRHIDTLPDGEREEVRQIFREKGLVGADMERVVAAITADRARWVCFMLAEEYGLRGRCAARGGRPSAPSVLSCYAG
jgi:hypothetical protein